MGMTYSKYLAIVGLKYRFVKGEEKTQGCKAKVNAFLEKRKMREMERKRCSPAGNGSVYAKSTVAVVGKPFAK